MFLERDSLFRLKNPIAIPSRRIRFVSMAIKPHQSIERNVSGNCLSFLHVAMQS